MSKSIFKSFTPVPWVLNEPNAGSIPVELEAEYRAAAFPVKNSRKKGVTAESPIADWGNRIKAPDSTAIEIREIQKMRLPSLREKFGGAYKPLTVVSKRWVFRSLTQ